MPDDTSPTSTADARRLILGLSFLCVSLAACSSVSEMTPLINPGLFQFHNCEQLSAARKSVVAKRDELKGLIEQAERGTAGVFVGAIAYRPDYEQQVQMLKVIDATARDKDCLSTATWRSNSEIH